MDWILFVRILWITLVALLAAGVIVVLVRTFRLPKKGSVRPLPEPVSRPEEAARAAESLSELVRFATVSHPSPEDNQVSEWVRLRDCLKRRYPHVHETMERVVVGKYSLLYRWASPDPQDEPLLFCAHLDVVPATGEWTHPAFSGELADGRVWGRGTLDCKHLIAAMLECAEKLCAEGFVPNRDIWFAFGHDEETGGKEGAAAIARLFAEQNMRFAMVLDEGGSVSDGFFDLPQPTAIVAVSEKGFLNVRLSVDGKGGHASKPPAHTALGVLSQAICRIEYKGRPARLTPLVRDMLLPLASEFPFGMRLMLTNLWLFRKRLLRRLLREPGTAALVRTTMAATMSSCGTASNVLPSRAEATINIRPLHGETVQDIVQYLRDLTKDLGVTVEAIRAEEASSISDYQGGLFAALSESIRAVFGLVTVVPYLMCGGTDASKYEKFSSCVYRFCPFVLNKRESGLIHNIDESVRVDALGTAVAFYEDMFHRLAGDGKTAENQGDLII